MLKKFWHLWALSLGEKAHKDDELADKVAIIRTILFAQVFITNCLIVANASATANLAANLLLFPQSTLPVLWAATLRGRKVV